MTIAHELVMAKHTSTPAEIKSSRAANGATPAVSTIAAPDIRVDVLSTPCSSVVDRDFGSSPSVARTNSSRGCTYRGGNKAWRYQVEGKTRAQVRTRPTKQLTSQSGRTKIAGKAKIVELMWLETRSSRTRTARNAYQSKYTWLEKTQRSRTNLARKSK